MNDQAEPINSRSLLLLALWLFWLISPGLAQPEIAERYSVERVVDGDTIVVRERDGEERRVRFIGLDCLEVRHTKRLRKQAARANLTEEEAYRIGEEAENRVREALQDGVVYLEFGQPKSDRYGRLRAYVWSSEGVLLNTHLLELGYALPDDYKKKPEYLESFEKAVQVAQEKELGIWRQSKHFVDVQPPASEPTVLRRRRGKRKSASWSSGALVSGLLLSGGMVLLVLGLRR